MNKTLKTYPDGSELTVAVVAVTAVAGLALAGLGAAVTVKVSNWRTERWLRKNGLHQDQHKK